MLRRLAILSLLLGSPAAAQLCDGRSVPVAADGRALGHLPYGDAPDAELVDAPVGFAVGQRCTVRRDMLPDLQRLLAAAGAETSGTLRGLSCHRSIARQAAVFCRERIDGADRAISVAPPGHSEHATGYALDFTVRPANACPDAEGCMAVTPAFRWLTANAPRFGFEISFPAGNRQQVKWEPWHWRWVGTRADAPGAARARFTFAKARQAFPAKPGLAEPVVIRMVAPAPAVALPVAKPDRKRRRRR